jgi:hypothetical protein
MNRHRLRRCLDLAVRQREWQIEEKLPELRASLEQEQRTEAEHRRAEDKLQAAHEARRGTLGRATFAADALTRHAAYAAHLRAVESEAREAADLARQEAESLRAQALEVVSERDAMSERIEALAEQAAADARRSAAREQDEAWLLRARPAAADGSGRSATKGARDED